MRTYEGWLTDESIERFVQRMRAARKWFPPAEVRDFIRRLGDPDTTVRSIRPEHPSTALGPDSFVMVIYGSDGRMFRIIRVSRGAKFPWNRIHRVKCKDSGEIVGDNVFDGYERNVLDGILTVDFAERQIHRDPTLSSAFIAIMDTPEKRRILSDRHPEAGADFGFFDAKEMKP